MNTEREARLNMYHNIIDLCENNLVTVALVAAFQSAYNTFKTTVASIVSGNNELEAQTGGYSISKKTAKKNLATMGSGIAGMVYAYAVDSADEVLQQAMNITYTTIYKALDDQVVSICTNIHTAATDNLASLTGYGVTAPLLTTFQTAVNDYSDKSPKPAQSKNYKKTVTAQVVALDKTATNILKNQMDKLIVNYITNGNAPFEAQYRAAREIIDPGTFSTVLKILVLNKANNLPIKSAKCYRDNSATVKKSSDKGFITYKDIEEGPHNFVLKHKLFQDLALTNIMISHGKKTQTTAFMLPGSGANIPVLTSVTLEADVPSGSILYIDTSGFTVTDSTTVQIIVSGNELLFSAAPSAGASMGPTVWHVLPGTQNKTLEAFGALIGADDTNTFLKVQCNGPLIGHYIITFNNVLQ